MASSFEAGAAFFVAGTICLVVGTVPCATVVAGVVGVLAALPVVFRTTRDVSGAAAGEAILV